MSGTKVNLLQFTRQSLQEYFRKEFQAKAFRATQVFNWIYCHGSTNFTNMSNLSSSLIEQLSSSCFVDFGTPASVQRSKDGTRKRLLHFHDNLIADVETVFIPSQKYGTSNGGTVCVSSQAGCSLTCSFCATGALPKDKLRNLKREEIVGQVMHYKSNFNDFIKESNTKVKGVVFMGQGEPLYNWRNVKPAIEILTDKQGLAFSPKRITVSTSGVIPLFREVSRMGVQLAISLHSVDTSLRDELVPLNKTFPLQDIVDECRRLYVDSTLAHPITFEYVMLEGVNDSIVDAKQLSRLLQGIPAFVNLIPFNPWPGSKYRPSSLNQIRLFEDKLNSCKVRCSVRTPKGRDIMAACGQLSLQTSKLTSCNNS